MSWWSRTKKNLKKAVNDVGKFHKDLTTAAVYVSAAPVNSVTGHRYNVEFETEVGGTIGKGATIGVDSVHIVGKSFANVVTGGYASKATDLLRDKEHKEAGGKYNEFKDTAGGKGGFGYEDKFSNFSKKGANIVGQIYGNKVMSDQEKEGSTSSTTTTTTNTDDMSFLSGVGSFFESETGQQLVNAGVQIGTNYLNQQVNDSGSNSQPTTSSGWMTVSNTPGINYDSSQQQTNWMPIVIAVGIIIVVVTLIASIFKRK